MDELTFSQMEDLAATVAVTISTRRPTIQQFLYMRPMPGPNNVTYAPYMVAFEPARPQLLREMFEMEFMLGYGRDAIHAFSSYLYQTELPSWIDVFPAMASNLLNDASTCSGLSYLARRANMHGSVLRFNENGYTFERAAPEVTTTRVIDIRTRRATVV